MKKHRRILAAVFLGVVITLTFAPFVWAAEEGVGLDSSTKSFLALAGGFWYRYCSIRWSHGPGEGHFNRP